MVNKLVDNINSSEYEEIINSSISGNKIRLFLDYFSDFKNTKKIREITESLCDRLDIPWRWKSRFILIMDEMNNNAIEHWSMPWEKNMIRVSIDLNKDDIYINIEVEDTWNGLTPKKAFYMKKMWQERLKRGFSKYNSIRWRWLFLIIYKLVDELYFKDSKKWWWLIVWIKKSIKIKE